MKKYQGEISGDLYEIRQDSDGWHLLRLSVNGQAVEPKRITTQKSKSDTLRFCEGYFAFEKWKRFSEVKNG